MIHDWFTDAKLGIFIHWGIYSAGDWSESWDVFHGNVPQDVYMAQAKTFTAAKYDPDAWAALFEETGAKYAVLTTKHHDGFALWDTKLSPLNAKTGSAAGRDLIGPYCDALRKRKMNVGLYFSHLDWSHPDYASVLPKGAQIHDHSKLHGNRFAYPQGAEDPAAWERFLAFHRGQLEELCKRYSPDLLWFDGDWERDAEQWRFRELRDQLHAWVPDVILSSRMGGHGDYGTPEQAIPITRPKGPWEFCVTLNDSWGYRKHDRNYKSILECVWMLAECAHLGGNLLLDIGPMNDGSIPQEQIDVLKGLGRWTKKHAEALYGSVAGLPHGHFHGPSTMNKAGNILYLILFGIPRGSVAVKGIRSKVLRAEIIGGPEVKHRMVGGAPWAKLPGVLWIDVPQDAVDQDATVIKVEFEGPLDLYTGAGDAVTFNL